VSCLIDSLNHLTFSFQENQCREAEQLAFLEIFRLPDVFHVHFFSSFLDFLFFHLIFLYSYLINFSNISDFLSNQWDVGLGMQLSGRVLA
jgi:hypothetical protein